MSHRIRESMRTGPLAPMGGAGEIVEIDETVIGRVEGAPKHLKPGYGWSWRNIVLTLVTREGSARSFHVSATTHAQLLPIIRANIQRETAVMTDDASWVQGAWRHVRQPRLGQSRRARICAPRVQTSVG
jgi:hypothetical protein